MWNWLDIESIFVCLKKEREREIDADYQKGGLFHSDERLWIQTCVSCGITHSTASAIDFPSSYLQLPVCKADPEISEISEMLPTAAAFWGKWISKAFDFFKQRSASEFSGKSFERRGDICTACVQQKTFPQFCKRNAVFLKLAVVIVLWRAFNERPDALQVQPNISAMARIIMEVIVK